MREKKIIIGVMCSLICIMAIAFAAFSTTLNINGTSSIESNWNVVFTNIQELSKTNGVMINTAPTASGTTATFDVSLEKPGDFIEYQITIENQGTLDAIIEDINASETGSDAIKFEIGNIRIGDILLKQESTTFNIKISYDSSITSQPEKTNNKLTVDIDYVQNVGQEITPSDPEIEKPLTLVDAILENSTPQNDNEIDFGKTSEEDGTKGLYYTNQNTEDGKTVYYYRGAVENNYVKFGSFYGSSCTYNGQDVTYVDIENQTGSDNPTEEQCLSTNVCIVAGIYSFVGITDEMCSEVGGIVTPEKAVFTADNKNDIYWKIIRINEDRSVRLIYQGTTPNASEEDAAIGESAFNNIYNDNAYVGYMYGTAGSSSYEETHANVNDSTIKTVLDNWYEENLLSYDSYITDSGFCGDRSIYEGEGTSMNTTYYGVYNRLYINKTPQFSCPQSNDLYTTSSSNKGNKSLDYPIGLITADEAVYAGGVYNKNNSSYYLSTGEAYWTMSPWSFQFYSITGDTNDRDWYAINGYVYGQLDNDFVSNGNFSVRPVINLKSGIEIISGDGTSSNPYVIKTV